MQKAFFIVLALLAGTAGQAQLQVQDRGILFLEPGAVMTVQGDIDSKADILGPGTILLKGMSLQRMNMNGFGLSNLELDNNAAVALEGDIHIRRALGHVAFTFPVGSAGDRYNPITLSQSGFVHDIGVRVIPGILSNGDSGIPLTSSAVNVSWELKEPTTGQNDLVMTADWDAGDELPGFDRSHAGIVRYEEGKGWDRMAVGDVAAVEGRYRMAVGGQARTGIFSIATMEAAAGAGSVRIFPNPARTGFYVYLPVKTVGRTVLNLFDLRGQLVKSRGVSGGGDYYFALDEGMAAGTYLLQVMHEGIVMGSKKIIVVGR